MTAQHGQGEDKDLFFFFLVLKCFLARPTELLKSFLPPEQLLPPDLVVVTFKKRLHMNLSEHSCLVFSPFTHSQINRC